MTRNEKSAATRRQLLALLGSASVASLAGCAGIVGETDQPTAPQTPQTPRTPTDSAQTPTETGSQTGDENANTRRGITFDRVVNAVDDLGWDPTGKKPIDESMDEDIREGTLIEVPPGTYLTERGHRLEDVSRWGIVGLGESRKDVQFVLPAGTAFRWIVAAGGRDILVENFTLQQGPKFDRSIGMVFLVEGNLQVRNVEKAGWNPRENSESGAGSGLIVQVTDPEAVAVVDTFVRKGPQDFAHYPGNPIPVFTGRGHKGTVYYRDVHVENGGEHGIYASHSEGDVRVEGGLFKNNLGDGVRISGEGSWVKGATVIIDKNDQHPENRGNWHQARGIHLQSGQYGFTGGLVEDCTVIARSSPRTEALLKIEHNQGAATVRNCRFHNDTNYRTIEVDEPDTGSQRPEKPWDVTFERTKITGDTSNSVAMFLEGRSDSKISDITIDLPGVGVDGITLENCPGTIIEDVDVLTGGYPIRLSGDGNGTDCLANLRDVNRIQTLGIDDLNTRKLTRSLGQTTCLSETGSGRKTLAVVDIDQNQLYITTLNSGESD